MVDRDGPSLCQPGQANPAVQTTWCEPGVAQTGRVHVKCPAGSSVEALVDGEDSLSLSAALISCQSGDNPVGSRLGVGLVPGATRC